MPSSLAPNSLDKGKVTLTGAQETLLITLFARAKDAESPKPILNDQPSLKVVNRIRELGYDFSRTTLGQSNKATFARLVATRARVLDVCTEQFLERQNGGPATILHLACGMDARSQRIKWQGEGRLWIDADTQDSVELRRQVMDPTDAGPGEYRLLHPNIIEDEAWLESCNIPDNRPVLVLFEGLTPYLTADQVHTLLRRIVVHFRKRGVHGEIRFDATGSISYFLVNYVLKEPLVSMGTKFSWYLDNPKSLEKAVPGLKFIDRKFKSDDYVRFSMTGWLVNFCLWLGNLLDLGRRIGGDYGFEF